MPNKQHQFVPTTAFADSKPHYELLDGLRGVAALMVVWYHVFEGLAFVSGDIIRDFNHGHLGVDFFFMLSGFVISYAYDDRWQAPDKGRLTLRSFFRRRLIRLHPMLVMGALLGCISFLIQGCERWDGNATPLAWVLVALLLNMFFIPAFAGAGYEVRGNGEMFPLNGPSWSLFFEYIGNILYAFFIRRLSNKALGVFAAVTGVLWGWFSITDVSGYGMLGVGWALTCVNFFGGLLRMTFPFTLGMLLARKFKPFKVRGIFWISAAVLFLLFSVPFIPETVCPVLGGINLNCAYEFLCIALVFPFIVWLGASGITSDAFSSRACTFLGEISYPLYIVHYPVMYLFYAWLIKHQYTTLDQVWPTVILIFAINITLAYAALKLYDEPVRRFLTKHFK